MMEDLIQFFNHLENQIHTSQYTFLPNFQVKVRNFRIPLSRINNTSATGVNSLLDQMYIPCSLTYEETI